jgi:hypothetical protein
VVLVNSKVVANEEGEMFVTTPADGFILAK